MVWVDEPFGAGLGTLEGDYGHLAKFKARQRYGPADLSRLFGMTIPEATQWIWELNGAATLAHRELERALAARPEDYWFYLQRLDWAAFIAVAGDDYRRDRAFKGITPCTCVDCRTMAFRAGAVDIDPWAG